MCTNPIQRTRHIANKTITDILPCGKCAECLKKKQSGYVVRCIEESKKRGNMWFVTLTYSEDKVPFVVVNDKKYKSLCREDIKKWKRETRKSWLKSFGFKFPEYSFMLCGEYGIRTHRPHYHGFFFGLDKGSIDYLVKYWQDNYGFVVCKNVPAVSLKGADDVSSVARYVAKYCVKPQDIKVPNKYVEKPRIQTSIGFGLPSDLDKRKVYWLNGEDIHSYRHSRQSVDTINSRLKYEYNGLSYSLPLYYRRKILYEKGINGNLQATPLSKVLSRSLRSNITSDSTRQLRKVASDLDEREAFEAITKVCDGEKTSLQSREDIARADLRRSYQKDRF